jgi:enoyl-[acyl-carrier protein] reductase II
MSLRTPICDLFEIEHPVFLAGMGRVAYAEVCAAVSQAGGYGTLGMAGASPEQIRHEMREVRRRTDKPFGVDLLAALPEQVNAAIDVIIDEGASSFIAGLGVPGPVIRRCHDAGLKVMVVCGKVKHALAAEDAGCDAVVAQGTEAGGHTGQVAGISLIPQTVDAVKIPVLAAGSIVDGRGLAAALAFGAQGVWIGTRFIASEEAHAAKEFKERILQAGGADTRITRGYSGKPMRVISNAYVEGCERHPEKILPFPQQMAASMQSGLLGYAAGEPVDLDRTCMPSGQGIGGIREILPAAEIVRRVVAEAEETIARLGGLLPGSAR